MLQELISEGATSEEASSDTVPKNEIPAEDAKTSHPRIAYELVEHSDRIEPHLRLWVDVPDGVDVSTDVNPPLSQEEDAEEGLMVRDKRGPLMRKVVSFVHTVTTAFLSPWRVLARAMEGTCCV